MNIVKKKTFKKLLQWHVENINIYNCNETFTNKSDFDSK